jgi:hypothetical protein
MPQIYISKYLWEKVKKYFDVKTLVEALLVEVIENKEFREKVKPIYAAWRRYSAMIREHVEPPKEVLDKP